MKDPLLWVIAAGAVVVAVAAVMVLSGRRRRGPDLAQQAAALLARLTATPGARVVEHCVSGDATCAIGIDANSQSVLLHFAESDDKVLQIAPVLVRSVEIVEDHETVARTARGSSQRWRSPQPRAFSTVRSLALRIEVEDEPPRVYTFNLIGRAQGIGRADPLYQYALQTGERWFDLLSGLMVTDEPAATLPPAPRPGDMYASKADIAAQLQSMLKLENGGGDDE